MLDTIDILESQGNIIAENIATWETQSITEIAQNVGKIGRMSKEDAEKLNIEEETKKEWDRIIAALVVATMFNIRYLKGAYSTVFEEWQRSNKPLYDYRNVDFVEISQNELMQDIIERHTKQNAKDIVSYTQTKALATFDRNGNIIHFKDAIRQAFDEAAQTVIQGQTDFYTAMRKTVRNLGGSGVRVDYGGGITRRLDTVARQNLLWNLKQAHREYDEAIGRELGCDGTEIDYHNNSRPSHRYMQGKQYSKGEGKTVNGVYYPSAEKEGVYARLYEDYGCLHYETSIILGVSVPRYSDKELWQLEEQDKRLYKIGNIEKDGYGWSQVMRQLETETRKAKDEINALSALGGNKEKISQLRQRIKTYQAKYTEISDITGIPQDNRRMAVTKGKNSGNVLQNSGGSGIIEVKKISNVSTGGKRNEKPLTESQIKENIQYAEKLGMPRERIRYGEHYNTAYGSVFDVLYIGTDVYPSAVRSKSANGRVSNKGAIAHEIIGHREAFMKRWQQSDKILDEIQASIRAARFAPDLTDTERYVLLRDAAERAKGAGYKLHDVQSMLNISER